MLWWDEKLATGIETIDNQHKGIFSKADEILCFDEKTDPSEVEKVFKYLIKYTVDHFSEEECLMMQTSYPNFEKHREQHTYFINELYKMGTDIGKEGIDGDKVDKLKLLIIEWLANHINESDKQFVEFYKNL